jgi:hypothetical protein
MLTAPGAMQHVPGVRTLVMEINASPVSQQPISLLTKLNA